MSRTIVIYSSKYGTTENYAKMIAQGLDSDVCALEEFHWADLKHYDVVVYGGGVYAGKINGLNTVKKMWKSLESKRVAVFAVGQTLSSFQPPDKLKASNFSADMQSTPLFLMKGQILMEKLRGMDKVIMSMIKRKGKKQAVVKLNQEPRQGGARSEAQEIGPLMERVRKWI